MRSVTIVAGIVTLLGAASARAQYQPQPTIDPKWLSFDAAARTARFHLIAGLTGLNGALNFNGFSDGGLTFVVPAGWQTEIDFMNHDGMLPHSAEIITPQTPLPTQPAAPAITRAFTLRLAQGLAPAASDTMRFTALPVGNYLIFCAVPGHGAAGMWIRFQVSASAKVPGLQ
jgi:sulfocyanin